MKIKIHIEGDITVKHPNSDYDELEEKLEELASLLKTDSTVEDANLWVEWTDEYNDDGSPIPVVFEPLPPDIEASLINATYTAPFTIIKTDKTIREGT